MFDSTRIRQLQASIDAQDFTIANLRNAITQLQNRNDQLHAENAKTANRLDMLAKHIGLMFYRPMFEKLVPIPEELKEKSE